jgi:hypothetical protein
MLGFVNGRSCAHKSKPRGLILKITANSHFGNSLQNYCFFLKIFRFVLRNTGRFEKAIGLLSPSY